MDQNPIWLKNAGCASFTTCCHSSFANSPFFEGKINDHKSWRSRIWRDLDADRTGTLPFFFEDGMGFQRYVDYALDVPMYFVYRNGKYIDALGQSFRDF